MPGAGRLGDKAQIPSDAHGWLGCPQPAIGPAISGSGNVNINGRPAVHVGDTGMHAACCGPNTWTAQMGSATVFINGKPAHRMNDAVQHCGGMGKLVEGSGDVIIGGAPSAGGGGGGASPGQGSSSTAAAAFAGAGSGARGASGSGRTGGGGVSKQGRAGPANNSGTGNAGSSCPTDFEVAPASLTLSAEESSVVRASDSQPAGNGAGTYTWRTSSTKLTLDGATMSPQEVSGPTLTIRAGSEAATSEIVEVTRTQPSCPPITKQVRIAIACERFRNLLGPASARPLGRWRGKCVRC